MEQYRVFEWTGNSSVVYDNPFKEVSLWGLFTCGLTSVRADGFYEAGGRYAVRFCPDKAGLWSYVIHSSDPDLDGAQGTFTVEKAAPGNHGKVCLKNELVNSGDREDAYRFVYQDGTPFYPFGTTCYAWINQSQKLQKETLETLKNGPFNKIRMCIFPKFYTYNDYDPPAYAYEGGLKKDPETLAKAEKDRSFEDYSFDYYRFNYAFFEHLEDCIRALDDIGVEVEIILLHPYDRWGFSRMGKDADLFYLSYVARRLGAFKNIWWSLANEYDLMPWKSNADWDQYGRLIEAEDAGGHLRSIHQCMKLYDHGRPWITHASIQRMDLYRTVENITGWRNDYGKPVIVDEAGYEGNVDYGWGSLSAQEETRRFWEGCLRGGYVTHGETYVDRGMQTIGYDQGNGLIKAQQIPAVWWAHGGKLYGQSPERIGFLRKILEEAPAGARPIEREENPMEMWDSVGLRDGQKWYLYYYGFEHILYRNYQLPAGHRYKIERIDTWDMTVTPLDGIYEEKIRIRLGGKPYMAVRMTEV